MSGPPTSGPDATHGPGGDADAGVPSRAPAPISCETAVRRLWDYLDGGLAAPARGEVETHLATCAECPPHFAFSGRTLAALAAGRPAAPTPDEDAALRARVRSALGEAR